jgi:hypothetical protein
MSDWADPGAEYEDEDDLPPVCNPFTEIRGRFVRGPDNHLRNAVTRYER